MEDENKATELRMRWVQVPTADGGFRAEMRWTPASTVALALPIAHAAQSVPDAAA